MAAWSEADTARQFVRRQQNSQVERMLKSMAAVEARRLLPSVVYFIGADHGPIKIGSSKFLEARLAELRAVNPYRLSVLASCAGGIAEEFTYHKRFAQYRLHNEWFERCPEIFAEIARLTPAPKVEP